MRIRVVINEQHKLLPAQEAAINAAADGVGFELVPIPAEGMDEAAIRRLAEELIDEGGDVVIVSPVPLLLGLLAAAAGRGAILLGIFHNDRREAVELNGKLIHRLHPEGWRLIWI